MTSKKMTGLLLFLLLLLLAPFQAMASVLDTVDQLLALKGSANLSALLTNRKASGTVLPARALACHRMDLMKASLGHAPMACLMARMKTLQLRSERDLSRPLRLCAELAPLLDRKNPLQNQACSAAALNGLDQLTEMLGPLGRELGLPSLPGITSITQDQLLHFPDSKGPFTLALGFLRDNSGKAQALIIGHGLTDQQIGLLEKHLFDRGAVNLICNYAKDTDITDSSANLEEMLDMICSSQKLIAPLSPGSKEYPLIRRGVFFGTFDPVHRGHISTALCAGKYLGLDKVVMIPNFQSSHKPGATDFQTRHRILRTSIRGIPALDTLPALEIARGFQANGVAGAVGILLDRAMKERKRAGRPVVVFQLMGTDSFEKLISYGLVKQVCAQRFIGVVERPGYSFKADTLSIIRELGHRVIVIPALGVPEASSSAVKRAIRSGMRPRELGELSPGARVLIRDMELYRGR